MSWGSVVSPHQCPDTSHSCFIFMSFFSRVIPSCNGVNDSYLQGLLPEKKVQEFPNCRVISQKRSLKSWMPAFEKVVGLWQVFFNLIALILHFSQKSRLSTSPLKPVTNISCLKVVIQLSQVFWVFIRLHYSFKGVNDIHQWDKC